MKTNLFSMIACAVLLQACNNNSIPETNTTSENTMQNETEKVEVLKDQTIETPVQNQKSFIKTRRIQDDEGNHFIKHTISEETIDSLNKIIPVYNSNKYNGVAVSYFSAIAESLHGRPYFVESSENLVSSIMDIFSSRLNDGTDIVFLIDKTGSMDDDIETVKNSLNLMMDYLSNFDNVKVGIAFYGDENYHYNLWYNYVDLTKDKRKLKEFMDNYSTMGNPDNAESVNDGIVKTVESMHWTEGNRRLMLVIGDAQSQEPPLSRNSSSQVIRTCVSMNVRFNLYPVIISASPSNVYNQKVNRNILTLGPNPANDFCNITFTSLNNYYYELNDMMGKTLLSGKIENNPATIDLTQIPTGKYLIQVYNPKLSDYFSTPLVVAH